jgi:hypothetical protein
VGVGLSVTSRAQAVPQIKIAQAADISNLFIGRSSIVLVQQLSGYLDVAASMRRWLKNRCRLASLDATRGLCRIGPGSGVTDDEVIRVALLIRAVDEALGDNLSPTRW